MSFAAEGTRAKNGGRTGVAPDGGALGAQVTALRRRGRLEESGRRLQGTQDWLESIGGRVAAAGSAAGASGLG